MWKPPQRIKYVPSHGRIPSREEAARARLFQPIDIGPIRLVQRSWVPAMVPWRATEDGFVTEDVLEWYGRFARGRPGAIVVEATGIRDIPSGPLLRIGHDRFIPGLRRLCETVRRESGGATRLFIQIIDFLSIRRRPEPAKFFARFLAITERHRELLGMTGHPESDVRKRLASLPDDEIGQILSSRELEALRFGARERVIDLDLPHIRALPQVLPGLFAEAAARAREAGFDGVELHYAHAYTMASFLSATNTRNDGYGGSREGRLRLPLEVFHAVRRRVGRDFAVGCRFLAEESVAGGSSIEDAVHFGVAFAGAGMDFLSTSRGGKFDDAKQPAVGEAAYPYTGPSGYECMPQYLSDEIGPFGRNAAPTAAIRRAVRAAGLDTPVVCTGGIHNFEMAERLLAEGVCDVVGAARQSLADPDWTRKIALGLGHSVRLCEYTNYCEGLDQKHKAVTCKLWDRAELDAPGARRTPDGKRRLAAPDWQPPPGMADDTGAR
ncbi:MAG TPA: NADH:flavin oxidoreductase [Alphaproteobacteria bacterium]|nr:NADH:flavin oxidoreductase [Alphaproteobacteria bacterium]